MQARSDKPSTAKGHKGDSTAQRAGRACAQGARPARGPGGHGGLRTPCFGGRGADAPRRTENGKRRTESARQARDGEAAVRERRWSPSSGPTASLVRRFRRFRRFRNAPVGRRVETARREADGREGAISGRLARSVIGVSPFGFARTRVFAGKRPAGFPRTGLLRCRRA